MVYKVADLFARMVCKLHVIPKTVVSDRDPIFHSHFWQELCWFSGTKLRMPTAYRPQSDSQTEIVNKVLQQYLRCFVHEKPNQWGLFLPWAERHYNTTIHYLLVYLQSKWSMVAHPFTGDLCFGLICSASYRCLPHKS